LGQAASFEPLHVKIGQQVLSNGVTEKKNKKIKNKKQKPRNKSRQEYISRSCGDATFCPINLKLGRLVKLVDVITCAKFHEDRMKGFDPAGGQSWLFFHSQR